MDTQFHTPSLGDDILDLTDCEPQSDACTSNNFNSMLPPSNVQFPIAMPEYPMQKMPIQKILRRRNSVKNSVDFNNFVEETPGEPSTFMTPLSLGARKQVPPLDGTESKGPISPYGHFFRDTACIIKQQNPNCTYQELTRIVSSMWLSLDATKKNHYKKKSEQSQSEYYKVDGQRTAGSSSNIATVATALTTALPSGQESGVIEINLDEDSNTGSKTTTKAPLESNLFNSFGLPDNQAGADIKSDQQAKLKSVEQEIFGSGDDQYGHLQAHTLMYDESESDDTTAKTNTEQMLTEASSVRKCTRDNCNKRAIINPDWEDEYCSNECVVLHCRNIFEVWKTNLSN